MATQGTNDNGSNMNRNKNGGSFKSDYSGKRQHSEEKRFNKPDGSRNNAGKFAKSEGSRSGRPEQRFDKNRGYSSASKFSGKDEDDEDNSRRSKPSRPKESKPSVAIPDKNKTMLRIEKEQKTMKKKQQSKKKESNRPQPRVKRANNVNYTRNYANGDYDDYEDYYDM